jgi:hypothetical protein
MAGTRSVQWLSDRVGAVSGDRTVAQDFEPPINGRLLLDKLAVRYEATVTVAAINEWL